LSLEVVVPPNATALVRLPGAAAGVPAEAVPQGGNAYLVPSGTYRFTVN
jgi:alpha-L-rhamnosidase